MHRILIAEDDLALARGLKDNVFTAGYEPILAYDGVSALEHALENAPDLILLDIMLPRMDGYAVCRAIRLESLDTPIIMLTARGQEEDIVKGLELGADDYVTKPFKIGELMARIRVLLRRHRSVDTESFHFEPFVLNRKAGRLLRDGSEIKLTRKEYLLLEFFLLRQNKALPRSVIMDAVWGSSLIVTQRSVDRCVTTLRGKIEENPHTPHFIKTIRDVGYRFEA